MRKITIAVLGVLLVFGTAAAETPASPSRAEQILTALSEGIKALGDYEVTFVVKAGEYTTPGRYAVGEESYYMTLGDAEVYGVGGVRYEVNNAKREVIIDAVDTASRNLLDNPVHGFDLLGSEFTSELLWERNGAAAVRLTPLDGKSTVGVMTLTIDVPRRQPRSVVYDFDGERVEITIKQVAATDIPPRTFDRAAYPDYEVIDFR